MKLINIIRAEFMKDFSILKSFFIISILLLVIVVKVILPEMQKENIKNNLEEGKTSYEKATTEYGKYIASSYTEYYESLPNSKSPHLHLEVSYVKLMTHIYILEKLLDGESIDSLYALYAPSLSPDEYLKEIEGKSKEELEELLTVQKGFRETLKNILKENKYYLYVEFCLQNYKDYYPKYVLEDPDLGQVAGYDMWIIQNPKEAQKIVDTKIEDEYDIRITYLQELTRDRKAPILLDEEKFYKYAFDEEFMNYQGYKRTILFKQKELEKRKLLLEYSVNHGIRDEILEMSENSTIKYDSAKTVVNHNYVLLGLISFLIVLLTSGGGLCKEKNHRTEKLFLCTPNKRWKFLLGKLLYLCFHMYVLWVISFIFLFICVGVTYGFGELFDPKLIYMGGRVVECNYFLYMMKEILLGSVPYFAIFSVLLLLSTIIDSMIFSIGTITFMTFLSQSIWIVLGRIVIGSGTQISSLSLFHKIVFLLFHTPFPYLNFLNFKKEEFAYILSFTNVSITTGIWVSILTILICFGLSVKIYNQKDIQS